VYAGLIAAQNFAAFFEQKERAEAFGQAAKEVKSGIETYLYDPALKRFLKTITPSHDGSFTVDLSVDASTYAPFYFGVFDPNDERIVNTMRAIEERLTVRTDIGGLARYEGDAYHSRSKDRQAVPGNPWIHCTLWLAQYRIARARTEEELHQAPPILEWAISRALPSGILAEQIDPYTGEPISVSPLTWAHATFVATVLEYLQKLQTLSVCPACGQPTYRLEKAEDETVRL
jgi:GH15 family glucan-1,4-alpha-glucosidase